MPIGHLTGTLYRVSGGAISGATVPRLRGTLLRSSLFGGHGRIADRVFVAGQPASRAVRLYDLRTGQLIRSTWSDGNGDYAFEWIALGRKYVVLAHDHLGQYNAAVADLIEPEPM